MQTCRRTARHAATAPNWAYLFSQGMSRVQASDHKAESLKWSLCYPAIIINVYICVDTRLTGTSVCAGAYWLVVLPETMRIARPEVLDAFEVQVHDSSAVQEWIPYFSGYHV